MKQSHRISISVLFILMVWTSSSFGQQTIFNKILPEDGGNFGGVTAITQDKNGFIWFATKRGFYKKCNDWFS